MSDKSKPVYQGVRVKITVKELLQRHRARQANSKKIKTMKTISQACLDLQDLCASTFPSLCVDPPPAAPRATDTSSCDARALQLLAATFPFSDSSCNIQTQQDSTFNDIQQQFGDMMLPSNGYSSSGGGGGGGAAAGAGGCSSYSASLPPRPSLPVHWCHGLSSDADYYGQEMAPCSSPESLRLYNKMDPNIYSSQDSFSSSSSSSCYDSPTRMESGYHGGFPSEHYHQHNQHCTVQDCYCAPHCWPTQQESFCAPEYAPYYNPTDYPYACPVEENYFKRDLQMSSEMCYNVL